MMSEMGLNMINKGRLTGLMVSLFFALPAVSQTYRDVRIVDRSVEDVGPNSASLRVLDFGLSENARPLMRQLADDANGQSRYLLTQPGLRAVMGQGDYLTTDTRGQTQLNGTSANDQFTQLIGPNTYFDLTYPSEFSAEALWAETAEDDVRHSFLLDNYLPEGVLMLEALQGSELLGGPVTEEQIRAADDWRHERMRQRLPRQRVQREEAETAEETVLEVDDEVVQEPNLAEPASD